MKKFFLLPLISVAMLASAMPATAQQNDDQPIEITAIKSVEWLRDQKKYIARENVVVTQGTMKLNADTVTADYREGATSSMEIWQLTAEGNVVIVSEGNTATGEKAVYDVPQGITTLTGQNLKLVSPDQTVTASEKMEYFTNQRHARAVGNAKVVRGKDTLSAKTISAYFKDGAASNKPQQNSPAGTGNLDRLEAEGNVVIVTPTETLRGAKAIYRADNNTAELTGNVKIQRGPNVLEGARAEVNLTTNVSKMFGGSGGDGRVRGVFFPGSDKPAGKTAPAPQPQSPAEAQSQSQPLPLPAPAAPATVPAQN